ncbi:MAG: ribosome-binding factor A [Rickettsiales bacterium]|nr:ribosome-binding factor A [Rickettsiales bacterium]
MRRQNNKSFSRSGRIESKVQTIVAEILRDKFPDLRITITGASASLGLNFVRIFYQGDAALQATLDKIAGAVRFDLAARIDQKYTPEIRFVYDDTLDKSERIESLLKKVEIS